MRLSGPGREIGDKETASVSDVTPEGDAVATSPGQAVECSARLTPFRAVCLQQASACASTLRRRRLPPLVRYGVFNRAGGVPNAHAWTVCGFVVVTGTRGMERVTPTATAA